jgi:uncharacterized protein (TIGR03663 family)
MNRALAPCLAIFAAALVFRIPDLADRPMHADEAVLADKFGGLLETGSFPYDPQDYHGPALAWLTLAPAWLTGAHRYADLTETTLRIVPALCGVLLVLMPLLLWDGLGWWGAVAAAGLTAISPAMVYYSRYYIPEMLLTTLTGAVIGCGYRYARSGKAAWAIAAGACAGLMFITKETAGIAVVSMLLALAATVRRKPPVRWPMVAAGAIAILIPLATLGFTNGWRALMSYWQRGIHGSMHRHAWDYYLALLVRREGLIVAAAVVGIVVAVTRKGAGLPRFLAVYACAITLVYSLIPYKTPWCVLGPLDAMIFLAGAGAAALLEWLPRRARAAVAILLAVCAANLGFQAWRASFPWSSDPRNPYAYAHTGRDVYAIRDRLEGLGRGMSVQVVSSRNLWPLPWYLRAFPHVEWWRSLGPGYRPADVIIVTPEMEPALVHELYEVPPPGSRDLYRSIFDRYMELRPQVELRGYIRANLYRVLKEAL